MKRGGQSRAGASEDTQRAVYVEDQAAQLGVPGSPFLTLDEVVIFLRLDGVKNPREAARKRLARHAVPVRRAGGRAILVERTTLISMFG